MTTLTDSEARTAAGVLVFCIEAARTLNDLSVWWQGNQHLLKAVPEHERNRVIAAKDRRKEELS